MQAPAIIDVLSRALPGDPGRFRAVESRDGMPTIFVDLGSLLAVSRVLRDDPALRFALLADVIPIDFYPREPRFEISYLLVCPAAGGFGDVPKRLRMKVAVDGNEPHAPSVSSVWSSADWAEREAYDLYGLYFDGHPDLRRILMPDDWVGHPLRKDYPVQIRKETASWSPLQLTPEEFARNVRAGRDEAARQAHPPDKGE